MSLVYICIDCLRQDVLDSDTVETPFLDKLRETGTEATEMHATATTTTPAVTSFMTGLYSERNGVYSLRNVDLNEDVSTLAQCANEAGYDTYGYVTGPLLAETGLNRGFDEYTWREANKETLFSPWFDNIKQKLASLESDSFVYVHLWELHHPIEVPEDYDKEDYGHTPYERALSALDRKLELLYDVLPSDTILAVAGDHGESISIRNNYPAKAVKFFRDWIRFENGIDTRSVEYRINRHFSGNESNLKDHLLEDGHGQCVFDFTSNIPFFFSGPKVPSDKITAQTRQIDIFPTLLDLLDIDDDTHRDGETLVSTTDISDRVAYIRGCGESLRGRKNWIKAVRMDGFKYIEFPNRSWEPECYNLKKDPWELDPLDSAAYDAEKFRAHFPSEERESSTIDIDDHLRDLGYL